MQHHQQQFSWLRRSNPSAAFNLIKEDFLAALKQDREMARIFDRIVKFKGNFNTVEDAKRLTQLRKKGADKLGIRVGSLPLDIGPGLALMYDAALEALRSSGRPIAPGMIRARALRMAERLLDDFFPQVGANTIVALETALSDDNFADHLRDRAGELSWVAMQPINPGMCEYCVVTIKDDQGNIIDVQCPDKETCDTLGTIFVIALIIWLVYEIIDWLW